MSHFDTSEIDVHCSVETCSTSDIVTCEMLLELFTSIPKDDLHLLHERSLELLSLFKKCKPVDCSISSTWFTLYS